MKNWYLIGLAVGLLVGGVLILVNAMARRKNKECQWDERQILERGECLAVGFSAIVFSNVLLAVIPFFTLESIFETPEMGNIVSVIIGIGAFAISAILKDAYFSINENKKQFYFTGIALAIMTGIGSVRYIMENMVIVDGKFSDRSLIIFVFLLWVVLMITAVVHSRKKDDEE